jgi:hypothetical protein
VPLEKAGNGGQWLSDAVEEIAFERDRGWYLTGSAKVVSTTADSVHLQLEQPEVMLANCIDGSAVVICYQAIGKPVPVGPNNGNRHSVRLRMVLAPSDNEARVWFLIDENVVSPC